MLNHSASFRLLSCIFSLSALISRLGVEISVDALSPLNPSNVESFLDNDATFLSNLLSSPERYASALNMTVEKVSQIKRTYESASESLHLELSSDTITGPQKHSLLCRHRLKYGRHPFVCPQCWSYLPVCVCSLAGNEKLSPPTNLSIVIWTHHREWGLTSNTGGLLPLLLNDCFVFMKGLPEHDSHFDKLINNGTNLVVILWPDQGYHATDPEHGSRYMSLNQVKNELQIRPVVLVAVDGTWRNARRMVGRLHQKNIVYADLSLDAVQGLFTDSDQHHPSGTSKSKSLLAPLRGRGTTTGENQVCTAEAVTAALLQLGLSGSDGQRIISVARQKVDLVCRYRAKVPRQ